MEKLISGGSLLGFSPRGEFEDIEIKMNSGDFILMLTDGVTESRNVEGFQLGSSRLMEILERIQSDENPLTEILKEVTRIHRGEI